MATEVPLAALRGDAADRVRDPPPVDAVIEDAGRQRLAAYYLYCALLAGLIEDSGLASGRWPAQLAERMERLGLARFAPRTERGLSAQLTSAEQASLRTEARAPEFAGLLVDLINSGAFGPLCGDADSVRLAGPGTPAGGAGSARGTGSAGGADQVLELIKDGRVIGSCSVQAHWELVAQHLAGAPIGTTVPARQPSEQAVSWLKRSSVAHAVSLGTVLAVHLHPLGAAAGLGTRLVQARIHAGREQADALGNLSQELSVLRAETASQIADLQPPGRT